MNLRKCVVFAAVILFAVSAPAAAQEGGVSLGVGPVFPSGDLSDVATTGYGFSVISTTRIGKMPLSFRLLFGYSHFTLSESVKNSAPVNVGKPQDPGYFEATAGLQFEPRTVSAISPYANIGWGYFNGSGSVPSNLGGTGHRLDHLGGSIGAGIKYHAATRDFFLDARYATLSGGDRYLPVMIGVQF